MEDKQNKNNLYTLSYFRKRLFETTGLKSVKLINTHNTKNKEGEKLIRYCKDDQRYWTIVIDPNKSNIICTCCRIDDETVIRLIINDHVSYTIKTESMETIFDELLKKVNCGKVL